MVKKTTGKKIMIVDDDKEFLSELSEMLKTNGYTIVGLNDASKISELVNREKPDLILMDIKMPGKSGFESAAEIKYSYENSHLHIPIIAMSAYFKEQDQPLMERCGISSMLRKPFDVADIIGKIENVLRK